MTRAILKLSTVCLAAGYLLAGSRKSLAWDCKPPSPTKQAQISLYLAKKYHLKPNVLPVLQESFQANDSCYWKLTFRSDPSPQLHVSIYLSPDGNYLLTNLLDLSVDPTIEERARLIKINDRLSADRPSLGGGKGAPITLVEFSDFECPFCRRMTDVLEKGLTDAEKNKVRIVFRSFPLPMHPWARQAAEMASCAAAQNDKGFWMLHDYLFENQSSISSNTLRQMVDSFVAGNENLSQTSFNDCLNRDLSSGIVDADTNLGKQYGIRATPTFFINGVKHEGAVTVDQLREMLGKVLSSSLNEQSAEELPGAHEEVNERADHNDIQPR